MAFPQEGLLSFMSQNLIKPANNNNGTIVSGTSRELYGNDNFTENNTSSLGFRKGGNMLLAQLLKRRNNVQTQREPPPGTLTPKIEKRIRELHLDNPYITATEAADKLIAERLCNSSDIPSLANIKSILKADDSSSDDDCKLVIDEDYKSESDDEPEVIAVINRSNITPSIPRPPSPKPSDVSVVVNSQHFEKTERTNPQRRTPYTKRANFTDEQLKELEATFAITEYPNERTRGSLGRKIWASDSQIKAWFNNRRVRQRKIITTMLGKELRQGKGRRNFPYSSYSTQNSPHNLEIQANNPQQQQQGSTTIATIPPLVQDFYQMPVISEFGEAAAQTFTQQPTIQYPASSPAPLLNPNYSPVSDYENEDNYTNIAPLPQNPPNPTYGMVGTEGYGNGNYVPGNYVYGNYVYENYVPPPQYTTSSYSYYACGQGQGGYMNWYEAGGYTYSTSNPNNPQTQNCYQNLIYKPY